MFFIKSINNLRILFKNVKMKQSRPEGEKKSEEIKRQSMNGIFLCFLNTKRPTARSDQICRSLFDGAGY